MNFLLFIVPLCSAVFKYPTRTLQSLFSMWMYVPKHLVISSIIPGSVCAVYTEPVSETEQEKQVGRPQRRLRGHLW